MLSQSAQEAEQSCNEHSEIVKALEHRDFALAEKLMQVHIGCSQSRLNPESSASDPLSELRTALSPIPPQFDRADSKIG
jgi:DNA-binding GntR family transcriptional regulator